MSFHLDATVSRFLCPGGKKKIVFTNGCFDILHLGHLQYLNEAKKLGDLLIVGLNSDESVRKLKGDGRPVNDQLFRKEMLENLKCVDAVQIFHESTPLELIRAIKPDILVKGGDYDENIVGADFVKSQGGKVVILPFIPGQSTTFFINRLRGQA
jgi:rfaE bifunctional protein nucleotidyltransferase chain/domain